MSTEKKKRNGRRRVKQKMDKLMTRRTIGDSPIYTEVWEINEGAQFKRNGENLVLIRNGEYYCRLHYFLIYPK